jgi:HK97 family phage major capsid protein
MKEKLLKLLKGKEEARTALVTKSNASEDVVEVRGINAQLQAIDAEIVELRNMIDAIPAEIPKTEDKPEVLGEEKKPVGEMRKAGSGFNPMSVYGFETNKEAERQADLTEKYEKRGADLKAKKTVIFNLDELPEFRSVTIGGGTLVVPKKYGTDVKDTFNNVSSLIDVVNSVPLDGGESFEQAFLVTPSGSGGYTAEEAAYTTAEPVFDYVSIAKAKITSYAEMSEESIKLPNVNYQSWVSTNISKAIRKTISAQIMTGVGTTNTITGIFNAPVKVIPTATDLEVSAINADTLDKIVFGYGGDEDVEGGQYLVLNKIDLAAFAAVRSTTGERLYDITLNGNTGTISSKGSYAVNFIINSICPALSLVGTVADTYCMTYGSPANYMLPLFSQLEVSESRDYSFKNGQVAFRGSVLAGGNTTSYKGFIRIKKVAAI